MPNSVCTESKCAMAAHARKSIGALIYMLQETGLKFHEIQKLLGLSIRSGESVEEYLHPNKKKKQPQPADIFDEYWKHREFHYGALEAASYKAEAENAFGCGLDAGMEQDF